MPKAYAKAERERIQLDLKAAAMECMKLYGMRKTTVDELVRRANIPKGTFYLFYKSKELLLFDALIEVQDQIQKELLFLLGALTPTQMTADALTDALLCCFKAVDESGLAPILSHGDFEVLLRKIPDQEAFAHFQKDKLSLAQMASFFPNAKGKALSAYEGAFRAAFLCILHKREIGAEQFEDSLRLLLKGLVIQLME